MIHAQFELTLYRRTSIVVDIQVSHIYQAIAIESKTKRCRKGFC